MTEVVDISVPYEQQIRETVRHGLRTNRRTRENIPAAPQKLTSRFPDHAVILDADLAAATHALTGATSCLATVCRWDTVAEEYVETDQQVKVWNHAEATEHAVNTFGVARHIDGHYWFFGDCEPMADRDGES
jgi:hypothetical protein